MQKSIITKLSCNNLQSHVKVSLKYSLEIGHVKLTQIESVTDIYSDVTNQQNLGFRIFLFYNVMIVSHQ